MQFLRRYCRKLKLHLVGVWTKALERRTDLPQKVVQKSLKVLEQQGLIKPIKSVKVRNVWIESLAVAEEWNSFRLEKCTCSFT